MKTRTMKTLGIMGLMGLMGLTALAATLAVSVAGGASVTVIQPDLSCEAGQHYMVGLSKGGHLMTLTGKGGPFEIDMDGWVTNKEGCASDDEGYGYTLVEFSPPVSDIYFNTFFAPDAKISCWPNYATVGSARGRLETGPSFFSDMPYEGAQTYSLGYNSQPVFVACWVSGDAKFKIEFRP